MGKATLKIALVYTLFYLCNSCTKTECVPIYLDFENAYSTYPFGSSRTATSSNKQSTGYATSLSSNEVVYEQRNCPTIKAKTRGAFHSFSLLDFSIAVRFVPEPGGTHVTLIQHVRDGFNTYKQHIVSLNVELNKQQPVISNGNTQVRENHARYTQIESNYLESVDIQNQTYRDVLKLEIKDESLNENRLIKTYYLDKLIGLVGFEIVDGSVWSMY